VVKSANSEVIWNEPQRGPSAPAPDGSVAAVNVRGPANRTRPASRGDLAGEFPDPAWSFAGARFGPMMALQLAGGTASVISSEGDDSRQSVWVKPWISSSAFSHGGSSPARPLIAAAREQHDQEEQNGPRMIGQLIR